MECVRGRTRFVALCVLAAALGCCTVRKVVVGPSADRLSRESVTISVHAKGVVYWRATPDQGLSIVFLAADFPPEANGEPPFIGGQPRQDQSISCKDGACFSYDINPKLGDLFRQNPSLKELRYKYQQALRGQSADGWIIIKP